MRKFMGLIALMALAIIPAHAQTTPQVEIMGGYSYLRADMSGADIGLHGWNASLTENVNRWLGGTAEFGGFYASPGSVNVNAYSFMFGPKFSYRKNDSFTPFAHVLLGGLHASRGYLGISQPTTDFAAAFGGGLDVKVNKIVSIRVIQADYIVTPFLNQTQSNIRLSAGVVLRFGRK